MAAAGKGERWAVLIVLAIGVPLVFMFTRAMADGEARRTQAPLRAMLGDDAFEALARGDKTEQHYMGNSLLAPDFTLRDRDGQPWTLSKQRGKVVLMNFWSITCPPCVEEMPSLSALAQMAEGNEDIEVVAITTDESWDAVKSVIPPGSKLKVLFDPEKTIVAGKFGSKLFPETWVIDRRGVIRLRVDGKRDWAGPLAVEVLESYL
jgi:peroxiredoxin